MYLKVRYTSVAPIEIDKNGFLQIGADYKEKPCPAEADLIQFVSDADVAIIRSEPCTGRVIRAMQKCRLIMTPKVGYENIDISTATEMGICVANIRGLSSDEVSDHAMALLLACSRKILQLDKMVRNGQWQTFHGKEMQAVWRGISMIRGQILGLIGFGVIARKIVPKAHAFGLNVVVFDPVINPDLIRETGAEPVEFNELLKRSDYISIHVPLTPDTHHMLGMVQFKMMKKTAYLINTARGSVVDEKALYTALKEGSIAGAGLDVFETEPVKPDNPLLTLNNVILTGHSAHYSDQVWNEQARRPFEEVKRMLAGEWPLSWVNPDVKRKYLERWGKPGL